MPAGTALSLRSGIYGSRAVQTRLPPGDYVRGQRRGMQGRLLGCPESRSQGGGLLAPGNCVSGDFATQEVPLHLPSPCLSLLHSLWLLALRSCCCCCVLPDLAGLTGPLKPQQGRSDVFLEEGHGLVAKRHEGTCALLKDAALMAETPRRCQLFGWQPLTLWFHCCSVQHCRWVRSPDGTSANPPHCWHSPRTRHGGASSHLPMPNCAMATTGLWCFGTGRSAPGGFCVRNGCIPANSTACWASLQAQHGPEGSIT